MRNVSKILDTRTPVVVLNCKLGGLAIMRSLGGQGVSLYGIDGVDAAPGFQSRYCREKVVAKFFESTHRDYLNRVLETGKLAGEKAILIPTSDELAVFVCEYTSELSKYFNFPKNDPALMKTGWMSSGRFIAT